ncbi:MAG: hypothetical protein ABJG47_11680 [Ekhidna sp.]
MSSGIASKTPPSSNVNSMLKQAIDLVKWPIVIAMFLTPVRFFLEVLGLPEYAIFLLGLLWLTLGFSIYWGVKLSDEKQAYLVLLLGLILFSPISRFPVALFWWLDSHLEMGTHYGLYFNTFQEALFNQVIYGSLVQIIPGFLLGSMTLAFIHYRKSSS